MDIKKIIKLLIILFINIILIKGQDNKDIIYEDFVKRYNFTQENCNDILKNVFIEDSIFIKENGIELFNIKDGNQRFLLSDYFKKSDLKIYSIPIYDFNLNKIVDYKIIIENSNNKIVSFYSKSSNDKTLWLDDISQVLYIGGDKTGTRMLKFQTYKRYFTFCVLSSISKVKNKKTVTIRKNDLYIIKDNKVYKMKPKYKDNVIIDYRLIKVNNINMKLFESFSNL